LRSHRRRDQASHRQVELPKPHLSGTDKKAAMAADWRRIS
jgi:hypothetical protein